MATWKQLETSKEVRLWISQIIIPASLVTGMLMSIPEVREEAKAKVKSVKTYVKSKFKKGEES